MGVEGINKDEITFSVSGTNRKRGAIGEALCLGDTTLVGPCLVHRGEITLGNGILPVSKPLPKFGL